MQLGHEGRLGLDPPTTARELGARTGELDRDVSLEPGVPRPVNIGRCTSADHLEQLIASVEQRPVLR
jgi:hypothetical protein